MSNKIPYADEIESIRVACFEAPKAQSSTEWQERIATIIGSHDGELFRELLRHDANSNGYLNGTKIFVSAVSGVSIAWMKMNALRYEAYVYSAEDGAILCDTMMRLGAHSAHLDSFEHWHDGLTHIVKGSL